jgi:hypothetical protein
VCLVCRALSCSELSVQLTQLQTDLDDSRTALDTALETEQGQTSAAQQALGSRIDEIKAQVRLPGPACIFCNRKRNFA